MFVLQNTRRFSILIGLVLIGCSIFYSSIEDPIKFAVLGISIPIPKVWFNLGLLGVGLWALAGYCHSGFVLQEPNWKARGILRRGGIPKKFFLDKSEFKVNAKVVVHQIIALFPGIENLENIKIGLNPGPDVPFDPSRPADYLRLESTIEFRAISRFHVDLPQIKVSTNIVNGFENFSYVLPLILNVIGILYMVCVVSFSSHAAAITTGPSW